MRRASCAWHAPTTNNYHVKHVWWMSCFSRWALHSSLKWNLNCEGSCKFGVSMHEASKSNFFRKYCLRLNGSSGELCAALNKWWTTLIRTISEKFHPIKKTNLEVIHRHGMDLNVFWITVIALQDVSCLSKCTLVTVLWPSGPTGGIPHQFTFSASFTSIIHIQFLSSAFTQSNYQTVLFFSTNSILNLFTSYWIYEFFPARNVSVLNQIKWKEG